jgi:hypothetical protein
MVEVELGWVSVGVGNADLWIKRGEDCRGATYTVILPMRPDLAWVAGLFLATGKTFCSI